PILLWILAIQLVLCGIGVYADDATGKCKPFSNKQSSNSSFLNQSRNFTVETKNGSESYKYIFRLCEDAGGVPEAGVIQIEKQTTTVIGRYDATEAIGGSDWVMLIYRNGEKYDKHCSQESRRAIVMITCDRNVNKDGCDFVCRSRNREEPPAYRGLATEP
uniref:MRH domain-containing protein n=1 Tax=Sphaeramia orbicularis TaxID=375764 RepID=A0A673AGD5_9TELE